MSGDEKKLMTLREADFEIKRISGQGFDAGLNDTASYNPYETGTYENQIWEDQYRRGEQQRQTDNYWKKEYARQASQNREFAEAYRLRQQNKKWYQFWI